MQILSCLITKKKGSFPERHSAHKNFFFKISEMASQVGCESDARKLTEILKKKYKDVSVWTSIYFEITQYYIVFISSQKPELYQNSIELGTIIQSVVFESEWGKHDYHLSITKT